MLEDRLWQIDLLSTSDDDPQLRQLGNFIRQEIQGESRWQRLAALFVKMGQFRMAEIFFKWIIKFPIKYNDKVLVFLYDQLAFIKGQCGEYQQAFDYYEKILDIQLKPSDKDYQNLAITYGNIGLIHDKLEEYSEALRLFHKTIETAQLCNPKNWSIIGNTFLNIGVVCESQGF